MSKYYVYYVYEKVERTREKVGFSCKRYEVSELIGTFDDKQSALKHGSTPMEKEHPDGVYMIGMTERPEKKELPPRVTAPKPKVDKKKKSK